MSYSQLILSDRPYGYWDCASLVSGQVEDLTGFDNHATISNVETNKKPIIYGPGESIKFSSNSTMTINNIYKIFFSGAEYKSASIDLFFSIKDSSTYPHTIFTIGNFMRCYVISDRIFVESGNKRASLRVDDWSSSQYLCVIYKNKSVSLTLNNLTSVSMDLGDDFIFPDSSPPSVVFGPSADPSLPLYINGIGIYTYELQYSQIIKRLSWSDYNGKPELIAIANGSEIINPIDNNSMKNFSINLSKEDILNIGEIKNLVIDGNLLTMNPIPPVSISSTDTSINYSISDSGLSFGGGTFMELSNVDNRIDVYSSIVRFQAKLDGSATNQTPFYLGPFIDGSYIELRKTDSNTFAAFVSSQYDTLTKVLESTDLGTDFSEYFNVSVIFSNNKIKLVVNDDETLEYQVPPLSDNYSFIVGNGPDKNTPFSSIIKNFCIDSYEENEPFGYEENGNYMLRFNNSFSVSQLGYWKYKLPLVSKSVSSNCYWNHGSKNIKIIINGTRMLNPGLIPDMIYTEESEISIEVYLETDDSDRDLPYLSELIIETYDDCYIPSNNGNYLISPLLSQESDSFVKVAPYEIKKDFIAPICRPDNLGIKFKRSSEVIGDDEDEPDLEDSWVYAPNIETTGATLVINSDESDSQIKVLEFMVKVDSQPAEGNPYSIFDIPGSSISLKYANSGVTTTSGYDLYIDTNLSTSGAFLEDDEVYYVVINFDTPINSDLLFGISGSGSEGFDGSMTGFTINRFDINNFSDYMSKRYQAILGRPYISKKDNNSVNVKDFSSSSQVYETSTDGKYFAMNELPKIKIVQNKWEIIK